MSNDDYTVYRTDEDQLRIRIDTPGERAVSTIITDPKALITLIAEAADLNVHFDTSE
jgi:hypothetical protein